MQPLAHLKSPRAPILRTVHATLVEDAEREITRALKVATLSMMGYQQPEIAEKTGATRGEIRSAMGRLRRAAEGIESAS